MNDLIISEIDLNIIQIAIKNGWELDTENNMLSLVKLSKYNKMKENQNDQYDECNIEINFEGCEECEKNDT
jgi:hypothetical protein